jgi:hypothetical protein
VAYPLHLNALDRACQQPPWTSCPSCDISSNTQPTDTTLSWPHLSNIPRAEASVQSMLLSAVRLHHRPFQPIPRRNPLFFSRHALGLPWAHRCGYKPIDPLASSYLIHSTLSKLSSLLKIYQKLRLPLSLRMASSFPFLGPRREGDAQARCRRPLTSLDALSFFSVRFQHITACSFPGSVAAASSVDLPSRTPTRSSYPPATRARQLLRGDRAHCSESPLCSCIPSVVSRSSPLVSSLPPYAATARTPLSSGRRRSCSRRDR